MTVPSIVDDILSLPESKKRGTLDTLRRLRFVAVGGGALGVATGESLVQNNIKLVNHYGITEIGAIAPVFCPREDYDWHYLRLRDDLGLQLQPISSSDRYKLIGHPIGWGRSFDVQDEPERNPNNPARDEVRIIGRMDDIIVLKSGEKVLPRLLEMSLMADAAIQTAVCVGSGFFEVLVIMEPSPC